MPIEFDAPNKHILITSPTTITTALEIYSQGEEWADEQQNMQYHPPMAAVGKASLGGGAYTDSIFILQYGWKIKPWNGDYILTIIGTVITDDGTSRVVSPDDGIVTIVFQVTSQGIITIQGSGVTEQDKLDIANLVWQHTVGDTLADRVNFLRQVEEGKWEIVGDQLILYGDNNQEIRRFNLSGTETKAYSKREPV